MKKFLTEDQIRKRLLLACVKAGSQRAWGEANGGYKQNFLSEVIAGKKKIPSAIVAALGCERIVRYVEKRG